MSRRNDLDMRTAHRGFWLVASCDKKKMLAALHTSQRVHTHLFNGLCEHLQMRPGRLTPGAGGGNCLATLFEGELEGRVVAVISLEVMDVSVFVLYVPQSVSGNKLL